MDEAGLSALAAADQLDRSQVSMTQDHYYCRKIAKTGAAGVLEGMDQPQDENRSDNETMHEPCT